MSNQKRVKHMEKSILQIFMGPCNVFIYTVYIINGFEYLNTIQEMHGLGTDFSLLKILVTLIRFLKVLALAADFSRVPNGMLSNTPSLIPAR